MKPPECYRLLGLPDGASYAAVKLAYRRRARLLHPDVNGQDQAAHEKFIQLTTAYKLLLKVAPPAPPPAPKLTAEQQLKQTVYAQLQNLLKKQRLPRSIALIEALAQRLPHDVEIKQWQGIVYHLWGRKLMQSGSFEKAQAYLFKAKRIDPKNQSLLADIERDLRQMRRLQRQSIKI
ncbi:J domain-containing protein [filamentous cyanobacterium LEGE 11480]|uniref:J domain-containing protein n=1 Tax=Romeriopsis navalis LEGE 11480 TaxID=2777977 RepID=A0A928VP26_9CYAN|nr:J domain-containing protein [Romeriopsis navalis]MBE9029519.1 J domain-containing protein [Romeriopsis navalis LEGE 11480]